MEGPKRKKRGKQSEPEGVKTLKQEPGGRPIKALILMRGKAPEGNETLDGGRAR